MSRNAWIKLARDFSEAADRYPGFRHIMVGLRESVGCLSLFTLSPPTADLAAFKDWIGPYPDSRFFKPIMGDKWNAPVAVVLWHGFGQAQVFYGGVSPTEDARAHRDCWLERMGVLGRRGVELAYESGVLRGPRPEDSGFATDDPKLWAGLWMNVVYFVARQRPPESPLRAEETSVWRREPMPEGLVAAKLYSGVFEASAQTAEHLARGAVPRKQVVEAPDGGPMDDKPCWDCRPDEKVYELLFRGTKCGNWTKRAKNQHAVLDRFEKEGWPAEITTGLGRKANTDTVIGLNATLSKDSPIRFRVKGPNVVGWFDRTGNAAPKE
jgi:hypothetical protein